jgi:hypothetical protein
VAAGQQLLAGSARTADRPAPPLLHGLRAAQEQQEQPRRQPQLPALLVPMLALRASLL